MSVRRLVPCAVVWAFIGTSGLVAAEDAEAPDLEFLEYLGSWEAAEEDWVLVAPDVNPDKKTGNRNDEGVDAPDGEKLAELDDES